MAIVESVELIRTPRWKRFLRWGGGLFLLLTCALTGYQLRPLNAVERQFIGTWRLEDDLRQPPQLVTYHTNRTMSVRGTKGIVRTCSWSAQGDRLYLTGHVLVLPQWWQRVAWIFDRHDLWLTEKPMRIVELSKNRIVIQHADGTLYLADGTQERYVPWRQIPTE